MKKSVLFLFLVFLFEGIPLSSRALDTPPLGTSYAYPLPAPIGSFVNLVYSMASPGKVQISIYNDASDRVISFSETQSSAGLKISAVNLCCLPPGVYLYLITENEDSGGKTVLKPAKFVVVR